MNLSSDTQQANGAEQSNIFEQTSLDKQSNSFEQTRLDKQASSSEQMNRVNLLRQSGGEGTLLKGRPAKRKCPFE